MGIFWMKHLRSDTIIRAMARTLWGSAWASAMEERGESIHGDILDEAPETPRSAFDHAYLLAGMYTQANKLSIASLYGKALKSDEKELEEYDFDSELAESFGHYLAMMALSHGVSWFDNHKKFDLVIPRSESHAYMHRGQWFYST